MKKYAVVLGGIILFSFATTSFAADVIIRGVNLGECKSYSDGCNTCSVGDNGVAACTMMQCVWEGIPKCLDTTSADDTQLTDLEDKNTQVLSNDFKLKTFSSCDNMESVIKKFIKDYYEVNPGGGYRGGPLMMEDSMTKTTGAVPEATAPVGAENDDASTSTSATDFSTTNLQVAGVDESELIKTDGTNLYFYNDKDHSVYIARAYPATKDLAILKKIKIPGSFTNPELFLSGKKLTILATKYSSANYGYRYWFNRSTKTVVVVYDVSDVNNLKIDRYYQTDGNITQSRMIGKYLYILSNTNFSFPYDIYYGPMMKGLPLSLNEQKFDTDFIGSMMKPQKAELRRTDKENEKNFSLKGKILPYNISQKDTTTCANVEYVLPDKETMKKFNFTPSLTTLSIIDTTDATKETKTQVLFGDVSEIHMSLKNLYIASHLSTSYDFRCAPGMLCIMPYYYQGQNTLIHKMAIKADTTSYVASTIVPGSPLNQYSMDEDTAGDFRIVTSHSYPEQSTELYILDPNLAVLGKLQNIAKGENFQSSRFIGNRLYLVTFQQIDPLFTIDVANPKDPKILGELKIPGYSTYLHPYDATHLIGVGYDTKTNQYGGIVNAWVKVDLYDVGDVANPKQLSTSTLGDAGSYSDVLSNPRLFVWNATKHLLFMPATLMTNAWDVNEPYRNKDAWQGTVALSIDTTNGVKEKARITHIERTGMEAKRTEECKQYAKNDGQPICKQIIGGGEYCTTPSQSYVPPYCYTDSSIGEYFAAQMWNYNNDFILRNLYFDDTLVTVSNNKIQANDIANNYEKIGSVEMK